MYQQRAEDDDKVRNEKFQQRAKDDNKLQNEKFPAESGR